MIIKNKTGQPFLSIIIPAYNEELRLHQTLIKIAEFLRQQDYYAEVLVIENGSQDRTAEIVKQFSDQQVRVTDPFTIQLLHSTKGKGAAVKHGMLNAQGQYLFMCDADLSMPIQEIRKFIPPLEYIGEYGIAIASRQLPGSIRYNEPIIRNFMGRTFNFIVRLIAIPTIQDTQCGFKCFTAKAAHAIFPLQRISGWGFDVEILHIAHHKGIPIIEIPIHWYYQQDSRISPIRDAINMLTELLKIKRYHYAGVYDAFKDNFNENQKETLIRANHVNG